MPQTSKLLRIIAVFSLSLIMLGACTQSQERRTTADRSTPPERESAVVDRQAPEPVQPAPATPTTPANQPQPVALAAQQTPAEPPTTQTPQEDQAKREADEKAKKEAEEKAKKEAEEKAKKEAKEARDRERKLVRLHRELDISKLRLDKTKFDLENAQIRQAESMERAQIDLGLLKKRFDEYQQIHKPNRIARAELNMLYAQDGLQEATEELEQLELMYKDEQFADKTKEIVVGRTRRRLERAHRDMELRQEEHKTLMEITIPQETHDQELAIQDKERALAQMGRDETSAKIERQITMINAEAEIQRLEQELSDVQEEINEAQQKKAAESEKPAGGKPG